MSNATDLIIETSKEFLTKQAVKAVTGKLVALVPFLGIPIVNPIFVWFISKYAHVLFEQGALLASMGVIEIEVNAEVKAAKAASDNLKKARTPEEIQKAKYEKKKSLEALIRLSHP